MAYKTIASLKYFYGIYDSCVTLEHIPRQLPIENKFVRVDGQGNTTFRVVRGYSHAAGTYHCKLYTSDKEIIDSIIADNVLYSKIIQIQKPLNKAHADLLAKKDRKIIIRDKIWYNKYKHRVTSWHDLPNTIQAQDEMGILLKWIHDHFPSSDSRIVSVMGGYHGHRAYRRGLSWIPTIFTNNEEAVMLFKLAFSSQVKIDFETCICLKELET